jgi:hypothetical protein
MSIDQVQQALISLIRRSHGYNEPFGHLLNNALSYSGRTMSDLVWMSDSDLVQILNEYRTDNTSEKP